jgi:hypothetical protein
MIVFGQEYKGVKRFEPVTLKHCEIDGGAILVNWKFAKDLRWNNSRVADWFYITELSKRGPLKIVETIGSYYNKLREV